VAPMGSRHERIDKVLLGCRLPLLSGHRAAQGRGRIGTEEARARILLVEPDMSGFSVGFASMVQASRTNAVAERVVGTLRNREYEWVGA